LTLIHHIVGVAHLGQFLVDGTRLGQPDQGLPCQQGILEDAVTPEEVFR
jgi:hypothetical protein